MDAIKNLAVIELDATELSMFIGGDEEEEGGGSTSATVRITSGSGCGGSTSATATVRLPR
jgi:hypothetical protein